MQPTNTESPLMLNPLTIATIKSALAISFLMLSFVFTGCCATGPFQSHSAFKQSLPSGYGAQPAGAAQWQSANYPPAYAPQQAGGYGLTAQPSYGYGGQAAYPQNGRGLMNPFVSGTYTSGSC